MTAPKKTAAITIRRLDPKLVAALKARAQRAGRSMEEEARTVLTEALAPKHPEPDPIEMVRAFRKRAFGDKVFPDSVELFREIRDEDPFPPPSDEPTK